MAHGLNTVIYASAPAAPARPTSAASRRDKAEADYLEQVIVSECAAWVALLDAVPDYDPGSDVRDLTAPQRRAMTRYLTARAERVRAVG